MHMNIGIGKKFVGAFLCVLALVALSARQHYTVTNTFRTQNLLVDNTSTLSGQIQHTNVITPPDFSGSSTPNYNPTGLANASLILQACTGSGDSFITGLQAQPAGTIITFVNTGYFNLIFLNNNGASLAANRFSLPSGTSWTLEPGYLITLFYTGSNWIVIGWAVDQYYALSVSTVTNLGSLRFNQPQDYSTTGQTDNLLLNSSTTIFKYIGTGDATITGFAGAATGRMLIVRNDSGHDLTLPNMNGSSIGQNQLANVGGVDVVLRGTSSNAVYNWDATTTQWAMVSYATTVGRGTVALSGGTATVTVQNGAVCTCTDTTAVAAVKCSVTTTTLTLTGTGTDTIAYLCR